MSPAAVSLMLLAAIGSGVTLLRLFQKHIDGQPLLPFAPRRPVPWNVLPAILLLLPAAGGIFLLASSPNERTEHVEVNEPANPKDNARPEDGAPGFGQPAAVLLNAALLIGLATAAHLLLKEIFGATRADLGLPADASRRLADARIGAVTFLAALVPIWGVQIFLLLLTRQKEPHPILQQMLDTPSIGLATASVIAACVAAPVFEETAFRLVLQGWLEKREGLLPSYPWKEQSEGETLSTASPDPGPVPQEKGAYAIGLDADSETPTRWGPIMTSAILFGLAHAAHGLAPIGSLTVLGLALGYVYQRTHRIVPCMVCHGLFNALSLALFFLSPGGSGQ